MAKQPHARWRIASRRSVLGTRRTYVLSPPSLTTFLPPPMPPANAAVAERGKEGTLRAYRHLLHAWQPPIAAACTTPHTYKRHPYTSHPPVSLAGRVLPAAHLPFCWATWLRAHGDRAATPFFLRASTTALPLRFCSTSRGLTMTITAKDEPLARHGAFQQHSAGERLRRHDGLVYRRCCAALPYTSSACPLLSSTSRFLAYRTSSACAHRLRAGSSAASPREADILLCGL